MGQRGPQPTPTRIREITGNPGKRALPKRELRPKILLKRPAHITGAIGEEWDRACGAMPRGFFTEADVPTLTIYCEALVMRRNALAIIAKPAAEGGGMVIKGSAGQGAPHPMIAVARGQAEIILKAADRLGMSPAARTRLSEPSDDGDEDSTDRFFAIQ
jgi:P27 family predicted phage terminase small subunit